MSVRFTKIDRLTRGEHRFLNEEDDCYFIGEFTARKGYKHSETNDQIISLKMKPGIRFSNPHRYKYKIIAIENWAQKLFSAMSLFESSKWIWIPIPGSCPLGHPEYDDRLERILHRAYGDDIDIKSIITQTNHRPAAHDSADRPTPDQLIQNWTLNRTPLTGNNYNFIVFDDVLTRGASFKAAEKMLRDAYPNSSILGVFLARTVHDDGPAFDFNMFDD